MAKKAQPQRPRQQNTRRLAKIQPGDAAGHVGMDAGGGVRDAGAGLQQMLAHRLVGKNADIAGLVQEIGRVAGAHDHTAVRRGDGLAQQAARVLVRHRQVGVLVRERPAPGVTSAKTPPSKSPAAATASTGRAVRPNSSQNTAATAAKIRMPGTTSILPRPAAGIVYHILDGQRGVQRAALLRKLHRAHLAVAGPKPQRHVHVHAAEAAHMQAQFQRFVLRGGVGLLKDHRLEGIVPQQPGPQRTGGQAGAVAAVQVRRQPAGGKGMVVVGHIQPHAVQRLPGLELDGLGQPLL